MGIFFAKNPSVAELISEVSEEVSIWAKLMYEKPDYHMVQFQSGFRLAEGEVRAIYGVVLLMYLLEDTKYYPDMNKVFSSLTQKCVDDCDRVFVGWGFKDYWASANRFMTVNREMRNMLEEKHPSKFAADRFAYTLKAMCSFWGALALMGRSDELIPDPNLRALTDALFENADIASRFVSVYFQDNFSTIFDCFLKS